MQEKHEAACKEAWAKYTGSKAWPKSIEFNAGFAAALEYARGQQEPVAWINYSPTDGSKWYSDMQENIDSQPLYTAPPAQPVQPAVAVNEHLIRLAKALLDMDVTYGRGAKVCDAVDELQQAIAAAEAAKGSP